MSPMPANEASLLQLLQAAGRAGAGFIDLYLDFGLARLHVWEHKQIEHIKDWLIWICIFTNSNIVFYL